MLFSLELSSETTVSAAPELVWEVFRDAARWPEWSDAVPEVTHASLELWHEGARLAFKFRIAGIPLPFDVAVTESDPPRRIAWASTKMTVTATRTFTFQPAGQDPGGSQTHTLVTDHKRFNSPILPIALFYPRFLITAATERWLSELKREAERRSNV